jgi:hypothetical protein
MRRTRAVLLLVAIIVAGCGTATTSPENWAYSGADRSLRSPPPIPRDNLSTEAWQLRIQQSLETWQRQRAEALEVAKNACAGAVFMACMKAKGWSRVSNPL